MLERQTVGKVCNSDNRCLKRREKYVRVARGVEEGRMFYVRGAKGLQEGREGKYVRREESI